MVEKEIKAKVMEYIKQGKNYKETKEALEEAGTPYKGLNGVFYKWKQELNPTKQVDAALEQSKTVRAAKDDLAIKDKARPKVKWGLGKQKDADNSNLAKLINKATYAGTKPLCKTGKLQEKDVSDVNLGGGVVGLIQYYIPNFDMNHPIVIVISRSMVFILKFKAICSLGGKKKVAENTEDSAESQGTVVGGSATGIKEGWEEV